MVVRREGRTIDLTAKRTYKGGSAGDRKWVIAIARVGQVRIPGTVPSIPWDWDGKGHRDCGYARAI